MTYERLKVEDFGHALLATGDLDPVYTALHLVDWNEGQKRRWLVAYWLFYHPGAASYMSEASGEYFWNRVHNAARNESSPPVGDRWPRASERRHFRGDKAVQAVTILRKDWPDPAKLVEWLEGSGPEYEAIARRVCSLPQFGPWMAFKVADMLERCLGVQVDFGMNAVTMFDDPKKAALMVARRNLGMPDNAKFKDPTAVIQRVVEHLIAHFKTSAAPPSFDRDVSYQEVETILCKWKSHMNGHYPVGKDCAEIREGLTEWATVSEAAREFLHWFPTGEQAAEAIPA